MASPVRALTARRRDLALFDPLSLKTQGLRRVTFFGEPRNGRSCKGHAKVRVEPGVPAREKS